MNQNAQDRSINRANETSQIHTLFSSQSTTSRFQLSGIIRGSSSSTMISSYRAINAFVRRAIRSKSALSTLTFSLYVSVGRSLKWSPSFCNLDIADKEWVFLCHANDPSQIWLQRSTIHAGYLKAGKIENSPVTKSEMANMALFAESKVILILSKMLHYTCGRLQRKRKVDIYIDA